MELLFEIGTEEIPPSYVRPALEDLKEGIRTSLEGAGIGFSEIRTFATPRRLVLIVKGLAERAEDRHETVFGPPADRAYDESGKPTKAATGFAASQGVDVGDLRTAKKGKGDYVCIDKVDKGGLTVDQFPGLVQSLLSAGIRFPKTMKWEAEGVRFARPVRWLAYVVDDRPGTDSSGEPLTWAGLTAGDTTRGHRFLGSGPIKITSLEQYLADLDRNFVIVDHEKRKQMIKERIDKAAESAGGHVVEDEELLERVTFTVEYPLAVVGSFSPKFLEMPKEVVVTALREHQDFFSVADGEGSIMPHFVAVANIDQDREGKIREGNERVLKARLDDAHFYWEQDLKDGLETMAERLAGVTWQEKLGNLAEKSGRVGRLAERLMGLTGLGDEDRIGRAARLFKADLTSEMVREKEFSSLQGLMGKEYALASGEDEEVAAAIYEHYLPRFAGDRLPETPTGQILALADKLDSIVGCFGVGLIPTGSEDPYALRRQAVGVARILIEKEMSLQVDDVISFSIGLYRDRLLEDPSKLSTDVLFFVKERLRNVFLDNGYTPDSIESVLWSGSEDFDRMHQRLRAISQFRGDPRFGTLITVFKRAFNICVSAGRIGPEVEDPDKGLFRDDAESRLYEAYQETQSKYKELIERQDFKEALAALLELAGPINVFFDEVMVMVEDEGLKQNRLNLLGKITGLFLEIADFSKMDVN